MARFKQMSYIGLILCGTALFAAAQSEGPTKSQTPAGQSPAATQDTAPATTTPPAQPTADESRSAGASAHLFVYRQHRYVGAALAPSIFVDDKQVVRIGNGRRASIRLTPGAHTIRSDDKSSAISIDVKAGQDYFVRIDEQTGFWKGHGRLTMLQPEQGKPEYKMQKPVEEDRKVAKDMIEPDAEVPVSKEEAKKEK